MSKSFQNEVPPSSNLLDDSAFRRELETILRDENLSAELRDRLEKIAPVNK